MSSFDEFEMIRGFGFSMDDPEESGLFFLANGLGTTRFRNFKESFSFYNEGAINPHTCSDFILRALTGSDDSLYKELVDKRSSDESRDRKEFFDQMSKLAGEMGIKLSQDIMIVRAVVTVERGNPCFNYMQYCRINCKVRSKCQPKCQKNKGKKRSERNEKLKYPMRILALRENENLID